VTVSREPVARALDVLAWLADHRSDPLVVRQIARDLDTTPSTVHRIFGTFSDRGLIARGDHGEYVTGLELYRICAAIASELSPARIAHSHLRQLSRECNETTLFGIYDSGRGQMMFIDRVEALHPLRYVVEMHRWIPMHAGATSLAILAFLPEAERHRIYATGLDAQTPETIVAVDALEAELERVRQRGYAHSMGQCTPGAAGFGAPVFDSAGVVCGDLCVTLPQQRFQAAGFADSLAALLMAASQRVSDDLKAVGYRAPAHSDFAGS
jgi:IclR family transcriptional regulator, acetate operon repressor